MKSSAVVKPNEERKSAIRVYQNEGLARLTELSRYPMPLSQVAQLQQERAELEGLLRYYRGRYSSILAQRQEVVSIWAEMGATRQVELSAIEQELAFVLDRGLKVKAQLQELPADERLSQLKEGAEDVAELLVGLGKQLGLGDKFQVNALDAGNFIVNEFGQLPLSHVACVFKSVLKGEITIYGSVTLPVICGWLSKAAEELRTAGLRLAEDKHYQHKESDSDRREARYQQGLILQKNARDNRIKEAVAFKVKVRELAKGRD